MNSEQIFDFNNEVSMNLAHLETIINTLRKHGSITIRNYPIGGHGGDVFNLAGALVKYYWDYTEEPIPARLSR